MPRTPAPHPSPQALPWPAGVPKPLSAPPLTDAPSDGPKVIRWIERNCVFGEGDKFGERVKLETFEKLFLIWLFEKRPDGRYRYRRALLEVPKGNGKTPISAWIGAYQLANQFSPVIPVAAASYDQAELLFGDMRTTVRESPTLREVMIPFEGEIQVKDGPGRAYKVAAIAGTNDGQRPSTFLADETHEWVGGNKERVHLVIANGCSKRDGSLIVNTTTPGYDPDTLAGKMHDYGLRVNSGEIPDDEFLFVWWGCPADRNDLDTDEGLLAAVRDANPAADLFLNTRDVAARYHQIAPNEFYRYHLGQWVVGAQAWLPDGAWDACAAPEVTIGDGAQVCLGFDGSFSQDSTALVVVSCGDTPHIDVAACWEREPHDGPDWTVPILDVEDAIRAACRRWQVREIVCDPFRWARTYQILEAENLPIVEFPQNQSRMVPATQRFFEAVILLEALAERRPPSGASDAIGLDTPVMTLADIYLTRLAEYGRAANTIATYRYTAGKFSTLFGGVRVGEATPARLDAALRSMRTAHGATMAKQAKTVLRGALQLAVLSNVISVNPVRDVSGIRQDRPRGATALTAEEVRELLSKLGASEYCRRHDLVDPVTLFIATGLRRSELLGLRWADFDAGAGTIAVTGKALRVRGQGLTRVDETKSAAGRRTIPLPRFAIDMLQQRRRLPYLGEQAIVFPSTSGTLRDPSNFSRQWREVRDELGAAGVSTHSFRKTVATLIDDEGLSARIGADQLGHAQVSMTQNTYMARGRVHTQVADLLDRTIGGGDAVITDE